jgi:hypothetical protein
MYGAEGGGSFMESRLRPAADKKLRAALGILADSARARRSCRGPVLRGHAGDHEALQLSHGSGEPGYDGKIKPEVEQKAKGLASAMKIVMPSRIDPDTKDAATHYATHLSKIFDGASSSRRRSPARATSSS